jgi:hypothetical protein
MHTCPTEKKAVCLVMMGQLILARRYSFSRSNIEGSFAVHTKAVCWGAVTRPLFHLQNTRLSNDKSRYITQVLRVGRPAADVLTVSLSHLMCLCGTRVHL